MYRHRTFYYFSSSRFLTYMTLGCAPRSPTRLLKLHQRTTSDNRRAGSSYWNLGSRCADEGHKFSTTTNSHRHLHILFFTATRLHVFFLSLLSISLYNVSTTNKPWQDGMTSFYFFPSISTSMYNTQKFTYASQLFYILLLLPPPPPFLELCHLNYHPLT